MRMKDPFQIEYALGLFSEVIERQPNHAGAHVGMAEAMSLLAWMGWFADEPYVIADEFIVKASKLNSTDWHMLAAAGGLLLLIRRSELAANAFGNALRSDKKQTQNYPWYHFYLLATHQEEEALRLARNRADDRYDDAYAKGLYALFLYLVRRFDEARQAVSEALTLDHNCWIASLALALVQLSCKDAPNAYRTLLDVQRCLRRAGDDFVFPGLAALASIAAPHLTEEYRASIMRTAVQLIEAEPNKACIQLALLCTAINENFRSCNCLGTCLGSGRPCDPSTPPLAPLRSLAR
jgi:tetratricopeptide (TPR) repeat protein